MLRWPVTFRPDPTGGAAPRLSAARTTWRSAGSKLRWPVTFKPDPTGRQAVLQTSAAQAT